MSEKNKKILDKVNYPKDLKNLSKDELNKLCTELREFLIGSILQSGGHFGSNLGVVELTTALHRVFDAPKDKLIWDVGHQAYAHKVLTGRKGKIGTIRQKGGLSPFPKTEESEYDAFTVGHSSTSISAATGMAVAEKDKKNPALAVAIIGDGAMTGGMAFEALNHAGHIGADMLVILNDNKMSISSNVGGMREYLTRLISSPAYVHFRDKGREMFDKLPTVKRILMKAEMHTKGMVMPGTLFEELGFEYYGPVDGHDVNLLVEVLSNLKEKKGPKFLHVITEKGKGYAPAENDRETFHAVKPTDNKIEKNAPVKKGKTYTEIFSDWICDKAEKDENIHAITPAMCHGSGLIRFCGKFPGRCHDVGIAEQHAVTFAAGIATEGKKPVVAIYSSFLQRAYDQVIHDVAIPNLDVLFAIDRAGIVGPDGATHAGSLDLSFLRTIPNMVVMAPSDENECYSMLETGYAYDGPAAVRYPRDNGSGNYDKNNLPKIEIGKSSVVRRGKKVAILSFGTMLEACKKAAEDLDATLADMRFIKPLDEEHLKELSENHEYFITVEDNAVLGGAGSAVNEFVLSNKLDVSVKNLGLPDVFLEHGSREEILAEAGLDAKGISESILNFVEK
ncbi:MAG TPA: 1-deoxy-D-xylulose-5-phosphate synthase [Candidatus Moranbacteria bacterium]|nr:1-deoxy-D-xylulose-5-phosphate synthase [Candidatus Moranbacteria bacterium]